MPAMDRLLLVVALIVFNCFPGIAQVVPDSLFQDVPDTVIIYNEPVIVKESIYIPRPPVVPKEKKIFAQLGISAFYNRPKYSSCDCYGNYFELYKKSTTFKLSYAVQGSITYLSKHLYADLGIGYTTYRTSFQHSVVDSTDTRTSRNSFNYVNAFVNAGYRIRKNKFSFIPAAGIYLNNALSTHGKSLQSMGDSIFTVADIGQIILLHKYVFSVSGSIKVLYQLSHRLYMMAEPFYMYEISSATRRPSLFYEQKNSLGLRIGFLYGI